MGNHPFQENKQNLSLIVIQKSETKMVINQKDLEKIKSFLHQNGNKE